MMYVILFLFIFLYAFSFFLFFFFFNDTATTEIYTLSLHDALPILWRQDLQLLLDCGVRWLRYPVRRSEEHTSELQSQSNLVCRLLLEKKKKHKKIHNKQIKADFIVTITHQLIHNINTHTTYLYSLI